MIFWGIFIQLYRLSLELFNKYLIYFHFMNRFYLILCFTSAILMRIHYLTNGLGSLKNWKTVLQLNIRRWTLELSFKQKLKISSSYFGFCRTSPPIGIKQRPRRFQTQSNVYWFSQKYSMKYFWILIFGNFFWWYSFSLINYYSLYVRH